MGVLCKCASMPHIHTEPGQIDYIAEVFVVYKNKVLLRFHEKHKIWIAPGGHIELNETPQAAAVREIKEEVGLDVALYARQQEVAFEDNAVLKNFTQLLVPQFINIHNVGNADHRHIAIVYFGRSTTDTITQPTNHEKAECRWLTKEEVERDGEIHPQIKYYAIEALRVLGE